MQSRCFCLLSMATFVGACADGARNPGGESTGGSGASAGNSSVTGGSSTGGAAADAGSGGASVGGSGGTGASAGASTEGGTGATKGGAATGGTATGGAATGGSAMGGRASGGSSAGTAGSAGSAGSAGKGGAGAGGMPDPGVSGPLINGIQWADTAGNPIQAHGGGLLRVGDDYYWFGENRNTDGTFHAVSAYRSRDLVRWEFVSDALQESSAAGLDPANIERPKVVYNASTRKYVMWMHWENGMNYGEARAAVASSSSVTGPYEYHGSFRPLADSGVMDHDKPGYMSRDCTLFVDDDGASYFLSASNENYDLNLYRLTADYLGIDRLVTVLFRGGHREAPALFKRNGVYFLLTSGATGWSPNQAQYATSRSLGSGWSAMVNVGDANTFYSQSTFVLPVQSGTTTAFLYLGDRWAGAWSGRVNDSTYVWQPITFPSDTSMSMAWNNTLTIDVRAPSVRGETKNFRLLNVKSEKALEVTGGSSENGADLVQNPESAAEQQLWSLDYNAAGYFRVTNVKSKKIIDVTDESTSDGAVLHQWADNNGDHQVWRIVDVGSGRFKLSNKKSGKFVTVVQGSTADGAAIEQRGAVSGDEQLWRLVAVP